MSRRLTLSFPSLPSLLHVGPSDLAVDLGTANTRVYLPGVGVVVDEPSVIALNLRDKRVLAVGRDAKAMIGRAPQGIQVVRPLQRGVIADIDATREMLRHFVGTAGGRRHLLEPRIVVVVPYGTTQVEKRAVEAVAGSAGARRVYLIEQPVAAALGAGLPVSMPGANTIVNIGGGTTEVAVMSLSGIVHCESMRIGGDDLDEAIIQHIRRSHGLLIGARQAEELKLALGSALPPDRDTDGAPPAEVVKGRALVNGLPKTVLVSAEQVREALHEPIAAILNAVRACLDRTPPELAADIVDSGIALTGGGALLKGLEALLRGWTRLPVTVCKEPVHCAVQGAGKALEEPTLLRALSASS
ncbi:MAG TPA: rod shape-determining protein [Methylomirabilota bacterium]|nr:rod shape-determining protein [Methylomirabilota bacterium]